MGKKWVVIRPYQPSNWKGCAQVYHIDCPSVTGGSLSQRVSNAENMMTESNGNIFHVTGLCEGNSPVTGEFP